MVNAVEPRFLSIRNRIADAAAQAGRKPDDIRLVAVSKNHTVEEMVSVAEFPVDAFGENRVQEAQTKREAWPGVASPEWRLIGHLQKNKARKALELFDAVDSVDSIALAYHLDRIAGEKERVLPILLEVNTSGEASKNGVAPGDLPALVEMVLTRCSSLRLDGLMTIGPLSMEEGPTRRAFESLRKLREAQEERFSVSLKELSMGMSGDFEWAILEGSTMVRVGTALFGPRKTGRSW